MAKNKNRIWKHQKITAITVASPEKAREDYYNNKYPKARIIYNGEFGLPADVRNYLFDKSYILEDYAKKNNLYKGTDNEKILKILKQATKDIRYTPDKTNYGYDEFWATPEVTLGRKADDCDGFMILIKSLSLIVGIPDYKVKCCAGWVQNPKDSKGKVGHAYCIYLRDDNTWCIIDGTYYVDFTPINKRIEHKKDKKYYPIPEPIWWTFTKQFTFSQKDAII